MASAPKASSTLRTEVPEAEPTFGPLLRTVTARLHYLDWVRICMILGVVYAHIDRIFGVTRDEVRIDDHQFDAASLSGTLHSEGSPSSLRVRWMSLLRQVCLPLLFWVSGSAEACTFTTVRRSLRTSSRLLGYAILGMCANFLLWHASPQDPRCSPQSPCLGAGILWDFSIVYGSGSVFPIVFQMWYVLALLIFVFLNLPLKVSVVRQQEGVYIASLALQWFLTVGIAGIGLWASGESCEWPVLTTLWVAITELLFLAVGAQIPCLDGGVALFAPLSLHKPPHGTRLRHYALAFLIILQWAVSPVSRSAGYLGPGFAVYSFMGFNKLYCLGFLMIRDQVRASTVVIATQTDRAATKHSRVLGRLSPLCSRAWPVFPVAYAMTAPSTNWLLAGNLTYPYYEHTIDRVLYCTGAILVIFAIHRVAQECPNLAASLPPITEDLGLWLYLLHPVVITILVQFGLQEATSLWALTVAIVYVSVRGLVSAGCMQRRC